MQAKSGQVKPAQPKPTPTKPAHLQQKLGYGFIGFGLLLILGLYFVASGGAYVFAALLGLMAVVFGGFQLLLAKQAPSQADKTKHKQSAKKSRH